MADKYQRLREELSNMTDEPLIEEMDDLVNIIYEDFIRPEEIMPLIKQIHDRDETITELRRRIRSLDDDIASFTAENY